MEQVLFFVGALGAIGGAMGVVLLRNPFFSVLALVAHLVALALLFLLLNAEFLAAAQLVVYAGAVMVLYVFVVAYIGGVDDPGIQQGGAVSRLGPLFAVALLVELTVAIVGSGLSALDSAGADVGPGFGTPGEIGRLMLERFLIVFEGASFLLLVAAVAAVLLAGRRRGLPDDAEDLPERAGQAPVGSGDNDPSRVMGDRDEHPPAGTAEGRGDPTVEHSHRDEPTREPAPEEPEESPGQAEPAPEVPA